eukprot:TRINITY_DN84650_c0_g1_i1.p1 TRINITY_DN84650_c0_g1~~TRINITY_DN84650_c0_g1_i1.p1  ORF type:complete len:382 (-),score=30.54 TRINITY_DN84650_c0_g1_i1:96-1241(-)
MSASSIAAGTWTLDVRATKNATALRLWASKLQRHAFINWYLLVLAVQKQQAILSSQDHALQREIRRCWFLWLAESRRSAAEILEVIHVAAENGARRSCLRTIRSWRVWTNTEQDHRNALRLAQSSTQRFRLRKALLRWSSNSVAIANESTRPLRALHFNYCRVTSLALRAWLLWLAARAEKKFLEAATRKEILRRTCKMSRFIKFWHFRSSLVNILKTRLEIFKDRRKRLLSAKSAACWYDYVRHRKVKAKRQEHARNLFIAAESKEALRQILSSFHQRMLEQSSKAMQNWPSPALSPLLPFFRHWRATVRASKIQVIEASVYGFSSTASKSWALPTQVEKSVSEILCRTDQQSELRGSSRRTQEIEWYFASLSSQASSAK